MVWILFLSAHPKNFYAFCLQLGDISNATKINWYKISMEFTISDFALKKKIGASHSNTNNFLMVYAQVHCHSQARKKNTKTQCVEWYVLRVNRRRKKNLLPYSPMADDIFVVPLFCSAIFLSHVHKFIRSLKTVHSNGHNRITRKPTERSPTATTKSIYANLSAK